MQGIPFTIISDCSAVTKTLEKRDINARIARWSMEMQGFDFDISHRSGQKMRHADALSTAFNILTVEDNPFAWNLRIVQARDPKIKQIMENLEKGDSKQYEMREGAVFKKQGGIVCLWFQKVRKIMYCFTTTMKGDMWGWIKCGSQFGEHI